MIKAFGNPGDRGALVKYCEMHASLVCVPIYLRRRPFYRKLISIQSVRMAGSVRRVLRSMWGYCGLLEMHDS